MSATGDRLFNALGAVVRQMDRGQVGVCEGCGDLRFDCRMVEVASCVRVRLCAECVAFGPAVSGNQP